MNTNKIAFFLLLQLISVTVFAQLSQPQLDSLVKKYTQSLHQKGIDTICVYNEYCIGCLFDPVSGNNLCVDQFHSLPTYIFWKEKGKSFVTKKDVCFDYTILTISIDSFWNFYLGNRNKIKKENLKLPQYIELVNGKKKINSIDIDHSIYFDLTMDIASDVMTKKLNSFFFTRELGPNEELNINYDYNIGTSLNGLHMMLQNIIRHPSIKDRFKKTLRKP